MLELVSGPSSKQLEAQVASPTLSCFLTHAVRRQVIRIRLKSATAQFYTHIPTVFTQSILATEPEILAKAS